MWHWLRVFQTYTSARMTEDILGREIDQSASIWSPPVSRDHLAASLLLLSSPLSPCAPPLSPPALLLSSCSPPLSPPAHGSPKLTQAVQWSLKHCPSPFFSPSHSCYLMMILLTFLLLLPHTSLHCPCHSFSSLSPSPWCSLVLRPASLYWENTLEGGEGASSPTPALPT